VAWCRPCGPGLPWPFRVPVPVLSTCRGMSNLKPGAMKTISDNKLATFVIGQQKKTRFQKEKEAREAKRKQQLAEAADIYKDFVASFEGDGDSKTFVRGGAHASEDSAYGPRRGRGGASSSSSSSTYRMDGSSRRSAAKPKSEMERLLEEMKDKGGGGSSRSAGSGFSSAPPRPKRAIDSFLDEIKTRQSSGRPPSPDPMARGSYDDGDPDTTNLYVGNLAPSMTEEALNDIFGKYGEIYSVKIMWPRTEEERARKRNCGFVSFMQREDAEAAKAALNEIELDGHRISVGWGKAIKKLSGSTNSVAAGGFLKPKASALPPGLPKDMHAKLETVYKAASSAAEKSDHDRRSTTSPSASKSNWDSGPRAQEREMTSRDEQIRVIPPADRDLRYAIDRLARYIAKDGQQLESMIQEREAGNPKYKCLLEPKSPDGVYYRWKVFSLLMGDKERRWRDKPFQMTVDGPFWIPPPMESNRADDSDDEETRERERRRLREREELRKERYKFATGAQLEKAREQEQGARGGGGSLANHEYDELQDRLQTLSTSRQTIKEAMGFALDHAEASQEVVKLLKESLLLGETPISVKLARLYLLSDILHNSSAPVQHASTYRTLLQACLPQIFEHLNRIFRDVERLGRMSARSLEEKVLALLGVWEQWSLYPPTYITGLEATFERRAGALEAGLQDVDPKASLDLEDLKRKAKHTGVFFDDSNDTAAHLLVKLNLLNEYVRAKASGLAGTAAATASATVPVSTGLLGVAIGGPTGVSPLTNSAQLDAAARGAWGAVEENAAVVDEDIDGVAMDEDIDGAPLDDFEDDDEEPPKPAPPASGTRGSGAKKRHRDSHSSDSSGDEAEAGPGRIDLLSEDSATSPGATRHTDGIDEDQRAILRKVETELIMVRDDLEAAGKKPDEVDAVCNNKREELMRRYTAELGSGKGRGTAPSAITSSKRSRR